MRFPTYKQPIQKINEELYLVVAEYPMDRVKNVTDVKIWLNCEYAFKSGPTGTYLFCNKIEEAHIVEE